MKSETTCGPLYQDGLLAFTGMDPAKIPIFAAGFVSGEAEKIFLGACSAAMFRPSEEWHDTVMGIVDDVSSRYGLFVEELPTSRGVEIWLCLSPAVQLSIRMLPTLGENSPEWHQRRGLLCGIPSHQIDYQFHKRSGFGEPCDR